MSKKFGLIGLEIQASQYLDNRPVMNCSDVTEAEIDQEVMKILKDSYEEAKRLLTEHRTTLDKIAAFLIEKETITGKEFMKIFHEVEGTSDEPQETTGRINERAVENASEAEEENVSEADAAKEEAVKAEALTGAETDLTAEPEAKAAEENDQQEVSDQTDTET